MLIQIKHNTLIDSHWMDEGTVHKLIYARRDQCKFRLFPMKNLWCTDAIERANKKKRPIEHGKRVGSLYKFTLQQPIQPIC